MIDNKRKRQEHKKVILEFLKHMEKKRVHLTKYDNWENNSIWSKENPQPSHRTMIKVKFEVERLNDSDKELYVKNWLENQ